jgi:ribonuclease HII
MPPDLAFEGAHDGLVAGVDEVGRGPWAGPVVAAAVILDAGAVPRGIDDSKALGRSRREALFAALQGSATIGIGQAGVGEIERLNILGAALLAMTRAVEDLGVVPGHALIDGNRMPDLPCAATLLVGGDRRSLSIAAASIIAKVTRDAIMARLAAAHPGYGWERNAGYGTAEHRAALDRLGVTVHHRRSFKPIARRLADAAPDAA